MRASLRLEKTTMKGFIANTSATTSETDVEILLANQASSKMIFLGDHTPIRKVVPPRCKYLNRQSRKPKLPITYI